VIMPSRSALALLLLVVLAAPAAAQQTVFLVRHAERADSGQATGSTMATDSDLSEAGRTRAAKLAAVLADSGITAIYSTEYKRTQQTAAPLAKALGIAVTTIKAADMAALIADLKASKGHALVVGHSNTIPAVAKALGVGAPFTIADTEYDNLFLVHLPQGPGAPAVLTRLHVP
jgi:broad specificity phosphatase PhoE